MARPDHEAAMKAEWLCSPAGRRARERAAAIVIEVGGDPLRAGSRLREEGTAPEEAAAALDQVALHRLAQERGMAPDPGMLLTRDGLEAGTGPSVARHRAELLRAAGARRVLDLTAGLGFDTRALLAAGLDVVAVERDPVIARYLAHNCPGADVIIADATEPAVVTALLTELAPTDVVFVDPARRDPAAARDASTARARPERDPERWSPPWSQVAALPHPRIAAKTAPGFRPPEDWQAQWVSSDRTVVECATYSWNAPGHHRSAAILLRGELRAVVPATPISAAPADRLGHVLFEVDPAVGRAGALPTLAADLGLMALGPDSSWLTGDHGTEHPALRAFTVLAELDGPPRERRRTLSDQGITRASVKCRDVALQPAQVLRDLGLEEGTGAVIIVTRLGGTTTMVLAEPGQVAS